MATQRVDFVKQVQDLFRVSNCNDVTIKYGYIDYSQKYEESIRNGIFVESEVDVNTDKDKQEVVLIKYDGQSDVFGIIQSIEGDSTSAIIYDIVNAVRKL